MLRRGGWVGSKTTGTYLRFVIRDFDIGDLETVRAMLVDEGWRGRARDGDRFRTIVDALMGDDDRLTWVLRAGHPGSDGFWEAIGFRRSEIAFERQRSR